MPTPGRSWPSAAAGRGLHGLVPPRVHYGRARGRHDGVFWLALAAVLAQMTLSSNVLLVFGIPYAAPGGLPLVKFHPSTYFAVGGVLVLARRYAPVAWRFPTEIARRPAFPLAFMVLLSCAVFAMVTTGISATTVYIESYASAALLGFVLDSLDDRQCRTIGRVLLAAIALNALLCVGETLLHLRLVPVRLVSLEGTSELAPESLDEFRGTALYESPLTGAMITMMGVFLCLASDLRPARKAATLAVLYLGLLTFGGRSALVVTTVALGGLGVAETLRRLIARRMDGAFLLTCLAVLVAVPVLMAVILLGTHLADRITARAYVDDSALVRVLQWSIFDRMDLREWMFGMDRPRLNTLMVQVGMNPPFNDVENFWLLAFFNLGSVGFVIWLTGLGILLRRLWRAGGVLPHVTLLALILVASGSNSLGTKSGILFICAAVVLTSAAFERTAAPPRVPRTVGAIRLRQAVSSG